ncbi:MAG: 50S ribosomal protein L31e [Nanoarchaeota archaeon]|nr:50S ribosomal protein L31e [Nanoarchaeota archaeon]
MAKEKKKESAEIKLQRVYNIPLRKLTEQVPRYRRAKRAMRAIRDFMARHMKVEQDKIKIGKYLNLKIWERSMKNIPHHVKVDAVKFADGSLKLELVGAPATEKKQEAKRPAKEKHAKTDAEEKVDEAIEKKEEEIKEHLDKAKEVEKEEMNLTKNEPHHKKEKSSTKVNTEKKTEKTVERKIFAEVKRQRP